VSGSELLEPNPFPRASVIEARGVSRHFRTTIALQDVTLVAGRGDVHALLGPNGAGKTTLVRILSGLVGPTSGVVRVLGLDVQTRALRHAVGLVPSGDRSFYLRISGLENLVFFGRLHGLSRARAISRARDVLEAVGLEGAADERVGVYSHGMHKRLSVARALLAEPLVLLVDEATHDLDPEGARRIRELIATLAANGTTVLWATQRIDEIRGFAGKVTLLHRGRVRFSGTVPELMAHATPNSYFLRLRNGVASRDALQQVLDSALHGKAQIARADDAEHYRLALADGVVLGDALASLTREGVQVLACREERSEIEEAFLALTGDDS
jgi:ABC-2 type transport system ATP-binding protein